MIIEKIVTREAEVADIPVLADLMVQLGYDTTTAEMETRFATIRNHPDYKTFVAVVEDSIIGMIGLAKGYYYEHNGMYLRILALVTNATFRKNGVGKALIEKAENWAKEIGAATILLNCGNREERTAAHIFYKGLGYSVKSSGFVKKL